MLCITSKINQNASIAKPQEDTMHPEMVYSLWNLKPCVDYLYLHHIVFRNPASGHRSRRHILGSCHHDEVIIEEPEIHERIVHAYIRNAN